MAGSEDGMLKVLTHHFFSPLILNIMNNEKDFLLLTTKILVTKALSPVLSSCRAIVSFPIKEGLFWSQIRDKITMLPTEWMKSL